MTPPPVLIALVGIDGAGKTTHSRHLARWLDSYGVDVAWIPNQTMLPVRRSLDVIAEEDGYAGHLELLGADQIRLIASCARLAALGTLLADPAPVTIVDRYTYCQYAAVRAQGGGNEDFLRRLNRPLPTPDLTLYLDVEPLEAELRIKRRGFDTENAGFLTAYRDAYRSLPEYPDFTRVDACGSFDEVQELLREAVRTRLTLP